MTPDITAQPPTIEDDLPDPTHGEVVKTLVGGAFATTFESYCLPNEGKDGKKEPNDIFEVRAERWARLVASGKDRKHVAEVEISYTLKAGKYERAHIRITTQPPIAITMPKLIKADATAE